ncbi:MAG: arginine--tRNA ligase [Halanaerobiaceae bacterium]
MINFKQKIAELLSNSIDEISSDEINDAIEIPPEKEMGDYAFPCFKLAPILKQSPVQIAEKLAKSLQKQSQYIKEIKNEGPYLNFYININILTKTVLEEIKNKGNKFGASDMGKNKNIVIDFSSPNVAKPFHVGHLRSTVIGNALYNIYSFLGYNCTGINHLGDWGTQFGKLIYAYKNWGKEKLINEDPINHLFDLYVKFHKKAEENPELEDKGRKWFKKLEEGNKEAHKIWKNFVDLSMEEFKKIYQQLNIEFDYYTGESFYNDKMEQIVEKIREKNLLKNSEGAKIVDLEEYDMPPCMIQKKDGATTYATRDLAAAFYRKEKFNFDKALYVTDYSQKLHFSQWIKVIELMGFDWAKNIEHIPFGRVSSKDGSLKTRKGNVILLKDLINKTVKKVKEIISEKNPDLENKNIVSKKIAVGAIIYNDLSRSKIKDIVFDWDSMLDFEGESGPYVQYTFTRINSVLEKSEFNIETINDYSLLSQEETIAIIKLLYEFPDIIKNAKDNNEPSILTRHMTELAKAFNKFYHEYPILIDNENLQKARLLLCYAVKEVLSISLDLLGIEKLKEM